MEPVRIAGRMEQFHDPQSNTLAIVDYAHNYASVTALLDFVDERFGSPHPRITLGKAEGLRLLTTLDEKTALLEELGVDNVIVIPFDRAFSALSGEEFADDYLIGKVGAGTLVSTASGGRSRLTVAAVSTSSSANMA